MTGIRTEASRQRLLQSALPFVWAHRGLRQQGGCWVYALHITVSLSKVPTPSPPSALYCQQKKGFQSALVKAFANLLKLSRVDQPWLVLFIHAFCFILPPHFYLIAESKHTNYHSDGTPLSGSHRLGERWDY